MKLTKDYMLRYMGKFLEINKRLWRYNGLRSQRSAEHITHKVRHCLPRSGWCVGFGYCYEGRVSYGVTIEDPTEWVPKKGKGTAIPFMRFRFWPTEKEVRVPIGEYPRGKKKTLRRSS